jgi:hypothetical protein
MPKIFESESDGVASLSVTVEQIRAAIAQEKE